MLVAWSMQKLKAKAKRPRHLKYVSRYFEVKTHSYFHFFVFFFDVERPPAFDPPLLEDADHGHRAVCLEHLQGALLGTFGSSWEPVEIQGDGSEKIIC